MVFRTFTQTYDMNTEQDSPVLLGIHTPIGGDAYRFLAPFFQAYKKYKYVGCDITIVNSARLPVDPEQVGRIGGTNYVDPRDTLNPMMFKGCHGNSLGDVINSMYGGLASDIFKGDALDKEASSLLEKFYYTALGDDSWRKSPIQKTLRIRGLHPLVYGLATQHQIMPTNGIEASGYAENTYTEYASASNPAPSSPQSGAAGIATTSSTKAFVDYNTSILDPTTGSYVNKQVGTFFTNKCQRLGWMDTLQFLGSNQTSDSFGAGKVARLPKIFMGILMLPPAYLCRQYLRVIISHKWRFSGYRTITTGGAVGDTFTTGPVGYADVLTGNVPDPGTKSLPDTEDYDVIEEVDEDESDN